MSHFEKRTLRLITYVNAGVFIVVACYWFLLPAALVIRELPRTNLGQPTVPKLVWKLHQKITPKFERWANQRRESTRATKLSTSDISGTEWPLFGSVFYLWATESLQEMWATNAPDQRPVPIAPAEYARGAIKAAAELVRDPQQANWVKIHWGENYLKTENVFYRMLVIAALTSEARLTGEKQHLALLRDQVDSLSTELDVSRHGLLDDYPGECYPGDIVTAIAMIQKADAVLGGDHSAFIHRSLRGFQNEAADSRGLVPYAADAVTGAATVYTRGCGNSYVSLSAPYIWPEQAKAWYDLYHRYFWQTAWTGIGFREFPNDLPKHDWYMDVDSGPVIKGFGIAACAFGVGAARVNGHFEHAYPLAAEMLATSWPLANGTLLFPRMLSNAADAPYLGEAAIIYFLTRSPAPGVAIQTGGSIPVFVWILLGLQIGLGLLFVAAPLRAVCIWRRVHESVEVIQPRIQFRIWAALCLAAIALFVLGQLVLAMIVILAAQLLPRYKRTKGKPIS